MTAPSTAVAGRRPASTLDPVLLALLGFAVLGRSDGPLRLGNLGRSRADIDLRLLVPLAILLWPTPAQQTQTPPQPAPGRPETPIPAPRDPVEDKTNLAVSPKRTKPGEEVKITGLSKYAETARFHWDSSGGRFLTVVSRGQGSAVVRIPPKVPPGAHWIYVTDKEGPFAVHPGPGRVEVTVEEAKGPY
jgi:hypothetical protein